MTSVILKVATAVEYAQRYGERTSVFGILEKLSLSVLERKKKESQFVHKMNLFVILMNE